MIKEIEDFEGYFVSEDGKIFSAYKKHGGIASDEMHELKPGISKNGYAYVGLTKER